MYNPNLDISRLPNDSYTLANGLCCAQVIYLWQGKPPFCSSLHGVFDGPLDQRSEVTMIKNMMIGIDKRVPGDLGGIGTEPLFAQGFYTSMAGFVLRTQTDSYTYVRPHIEAEMAESQES